MIQTFVWFCSREDYHLLLRSVRSVHSLFPNANIVVFDNLESGFALSNRAVTALRYLGAIITPVSISDAWKGHQKAKNKITSLRWAADITGADRVISLTPGTLVLNTSWLTGEFMAVSTCSGTPEVIDARIFACTAPVLSALEESLKTELTPPWDTDEDFEIASRIHRLFPKEACRKILYSPSGLHPAIPDARAGAWRVTQSDDQWLAVMADRWQFAGFDEASSLSPHQRARAMNRLLTICNSRH